MKFSPFAYLALAFLLSLCLTIALAVMIVRSDRAAMYRHDELKGGMVNIFRNQHMLSQTCKPGIEL
ncbi:hypothetical protein K3758_05395 [Sulfitobacter sp. W002]|uniref:hypothetical protein n=1 Tax=Sulfitobacter sp. W002 TaxID=2867024 RepID=UPI0021A4B2E3|nr:hypothetical protein [Sulfitobacter sp. W002]UWR30964.1 hypothetical protein K3758_05395 [Sulfitobacter sp. W002]